MNTLLDNLRKHLSNITPEQFQIEWAEIEKMGFAGVPIEEFLSNYKPSLLKWIEKMFDHAEKRQWYETYWLFDVHGVISRPDYRKNVKETLQFITKNRPDIIMILFTSSYPDEIKVYMDTFAKDGIHFKYVNENPEISDAKGTFGCYDKKPYYNVLFEDKSGFDPEIDWKPIYEYFLNSEYKPDPSWSFKTVESYHKKE